MSLVSQPAVCEKECQCNPPPGDTKLIVVTGGPGAGKTAILEIIRKQLCKHVVILPEAASIVFGGGFWRLPSITGQLAAQRAILHIQQDIERLVVDEKKWAVGLCDRGVLDGFAYWPGDEAAFWAAGKTSLHAEYERYHAVIHLRTPTEALGYNHENPLRTESAAQAKVIDNKIAAVWSKHPRYHVIKSTPDFLTKAQTALRYIINDLPQDCARALQIFPE